MASLYPLHSFHRASRPTSSAAAAVPPAASGMPEALWNTCNPPHELHIRGKPEALSLLSRLSHLGLAVVGTRTPSPRSIEFLRSVFRDLEGTGLIILSGLARGIDAAAHEAALDCGLPTLAFVAGGVDLPYPPENQALRERILASGGLIISERSGTTPPYPSHFLDRNRLIAGWSQATWVVEAPFHSGALNTAMWTRKHHRQTYVTPSFPGDPAFAGNLGLLETEGTLVLSSRISLGHTWPSFSTPREVRGRRAQPAPPAESASDEAHLHWEVRKQTLSHGCARVEATLEWATARGWEPGRYFLALQKCILAGDLVDRAGSLVAREGR